MLHAGEVIRVGNQTPEHPQAAGAGREEHTRPGREKSLPLAVAPWCPLPIKLNIMPAGKGKIFTGSSSIFVKQANNDEFGAESPQTDDGMLLSVIKRHTIEMLFPISAKPNVVHCQ